MDVAFFSCLFYLSYSSILSGINASSNTTIVSAPGHDTAEAKFRSAIALAIKRSVKSRQEIADSMNRLLNRPPKALITVHQVNAWTSATKERVRFPAAWVPAFCEAAMNDAPQLALLTPEHRTRLEIKKDLEALRSAVTALLVAERKRARTKNRGAGRPERAKKVKGKK